MFIALEGPDGSGKSSMIAPLRQHLLARGVDPLCVRDPGGTGVGAAIREILLDRANAGICPLTELLLYLASRAQLVAQSIRPALEAGRTVLSDRFTLSTLAYQGAAGVLPDGELARVVELGAGGLRPDCVILLDVPAAVGLARVGAGVDRMEAKGEGFHREVRRRYLELASRAPAGSVRVVDATRPLPVVRAEVVEIVDDLLQ